MKLCIVGTGYVGLVSGACLADLGHHVICVDKDAAKIDGLKQGRMPIYEPGLKALVERNSGAGRLVFSIDLTESAKHADIIVIAVGTPSREEDGEADLSFVFAAAEEAAAAIEGFSVVVTKSTVPVGTGAKLEALIGRIAKPGSFAVASNPEFLREGSAIGDFMEPDRVVVGVENHQARDYLEQLYQPLAAKGVPLLFTDIASAELIKYASNAFLATKIGFINEIADLCEAARADVQLVARGIGLDNRIGDKFLQPGPGYGGSCFPKDTRALLATAEQHGVDVRIVAAAVAANNHRKQAMAEKICAALGGNVTNKVIAVLGLTFKPNTDDMREAPSLAILPVLLERGATLRGYDPVGADEAKKLLPDIEYCDSSEAAIAGADACVILTEWDEFRALDLDQVKESLAQPILVDLRNVFDPAAAARAGLKYVSVGRGTRDSVSAEISEA